MCGKLVKEVLFSEPFSLQASASCREAGEALSRPEVRAVFICDGDVLVCVVTRKTLVREVVARGLDPTATHLGQVAEQPNATIDAGERLADAFAFLEAH